MVEIFNQSSVLSLLDYDKTQWDANSVIIFKPNGLNFIILSLTVLMNLFTVPETKQYSRLTLYSSRRSKSQYIIHTVYSGVPSQDAIILKESLLTGSGICLYKARLK